MKSNIKNILLILLILLVAILSFKLIFSTKDKDTSQVDSTIVVEKIQKVMKLVTVEGNYSELMSYKDFDYVDFPGFRKDAILRVNAKVSVGYNLENMKITTDDKTKTITIQQMPKPEILSIDSDIKFENISTGLFTSFNEAELTKLNALGKEKIRKKAISTDLLSKAEEQRKDMFDLLFYMAEQNGYKIIIEGTALKPINIKE